MGEGSWESTGLALIRSHRGKERQDETRPAVWGKQAFPLAWGDWPPCAGRVNSA